MAEQTTSSIVVDAPPAEVMAVIADFPAYPEWAQGMKPAEVLERAPTVGPTRCTSSSRRRRSRTPTPWPTTGRATVGHLGRWSRARCSRRWRAPTCCVPRGDGTEVTYRLAVDLSIPMIGMLKRKAEKVIIDTALKGLKKRVESLR